MNNNTFSKCVLLCVSQAILLSSAYAIKIVIPEQYKDQVAAIKDAEQAEREKELAAGLDADSEMPKAESALKVDAEEFLVQSVAEATEAAEALGDDLAADQGLVSGQIVDKATGEAIEGVAILLEGTELRALTDADGRYSIGPAQAGIYTLRFIDPDYLKASVRDYEITGGEVSIFPFALEPRPVEMSDEVYELQDFTVTAEEANQLMANLEIRMDSVASLDMLGSEDFSRFGASDAADALKSVTGVSISGGKYAVVRGLDDRFSTTSLNGIVIPSPDPDRLAVPLDIFPAGLLESVVTQKSYTADQPGESSGGAINLITKSHPEEFTAKISAGLTYQENATGEDDFLLASEENFQGSPFRFAPRSKTPGFDTSFSGEIGNSFEHRGLDIGIIGGVSFSQKYSYSLVERNRLTDNGGNSSVASSSEQAVSEHEEQLSALIGVSVRLSDETSLNYTGLHVKKDEATGTFSNIETQSSDPIFSTSAETVSRTYWNHQLVFDHTFAKLLGLDEINLKLSYAYSTNEQDEPDTRFSDTLDEGSEEGTFDSTDFGQPVRYERFLEQEDHIFKADFDVPYKLFDEDAALKFGFSNEDTVREVEQREFLGAQFDDASLDDMGTTNPDLIIIPGVLEFPGDPHFIDIPGVTVIESGVSEGIREIRSIYLQNTFSPIDALELTAGVRLEDSLIEANAIEPGKLTRFVFEPVVESRPIDEDSVLPAFTATYDVNDDLQLRFGWSQTVAKPSFRELNPNPTFNPATGDAEIGNPGLVFLNAGTTDTVLPEEFSGLELVDVENIDLRAEWFFSEENLLSLSLFNKTVDGPIERIEALTGGGSSFTFFNNDNEADVYGIEFEFRLALSDLSESLSGFYVGGNYTYIDATVERSSLETLLLPATASKERSLFNQPEDIVNAYINYRNEDRGLDVTLSANQVGSQLYGVTPAGDIYIDPHLTLNLVISWKITDNISVKLSGKNLLDPSKERSYETFGDITDPESIGDAGGVAGEDTDFSIRDSYKSGRSYGVSLSYVF